MRIPKRSRTRGGFTLVELMIVTALIGALAAIAIPNFIFYQARSRRSEGYTNLSSLGRALIAFQAETGNYPDMLAESGEVTLPDPTLYSGLGTLKMPWDGQTQGYFNKVGWQAEGQVFYTYDVNSARGCGCTSCFTASAHGDVDGDGRVSTMMYVHPQRAGNGGLIGNCPDGVFGYQPPFDPVTGDDIFDAVGIRVDLDQY